MHTSRTLPTPCQSLTRTETLCTHLVWRPKKKSPRTFCRTRIRIKVHQVSSPRIYHLRCDNNCTRWALLFSHWNANQFELQITFFCWERKISVNAENNESFIYILFKLCGQVWSRLPNSTIAPLYFVGFLCAMTLLSDLAWPTFSLFPIYVNSQKVCTWVFQFIKWKNRFLYYDLEIFACVRIPTQIQINITYTNPKSHMHPSVHTHLGLVQFISFQSPLYYFYKCWPKEIHDKFCTS